MLLIPLFCSLLTQQTQASGTLKRKDNPLNQNKNKNAKRGIDQNTYYFYQLILYLKTQNLIEALSLLQKLSPAIRTSFFLRQIPSIKSGNLIHLVCNPLNERALFMLLSYNPPLNFINTDDETALDLILNANNPPLAPIKWLAEKNPLLVTRIDQRGYSVLHRAVENLSLSAEVIEFLIKKGAPLTHRLPDGPNPAEHALNALNMMALLALDKHKVHITFPPVPKDNTTLFFPFFYQSILLLRDAEKKSKKKFIKILGKALKTASKKEEMIVTPQDFLEATSSYQYKLLKLIDKYYGGSDNYLTLLTATDEDKNTVLHKLAIRQSQPNGKKFYWKSKGEKILKLFLKHKAIIYSLVNQPNNKKELPLLIAAGKHNHGLVEQLLDIDADPNKKNDNGETPFSLIYSPRQLSKNSIQVIQKMIEHGAKVNEPPCNECPTFMTLVTRKGKESHVNEQFVFDLIMDNDGIIHFPKKDIDKITMRERLPRFICNYLKSKLPDPTVQDQINAENLREQIDEKIITGNNLFGPNKFSQKLIESITKGSLPITPKSKKPPIATPFEEFITKFVCSLFIHPNTLLSIKRTIHCDQARYKAIQHIALTPEELETYKKNFKKLKGIGSLMLISCTKKRSETFFQQLYVYQSPEQSFKKDIMINVTPPVQ